MTDEPMHLTTPSVGADPEDCPRCLSMLWPGDTCGMCKARDEAIEMTKLAPADMPWPDVDPETGDAETQATRHGGFLSELALPHVWLYASGRYKRKVTVSITRHPGFPHYHVRIEEDGDMVWARAPDGHFVWTSPWHNSPEREGVRHWIGKTIHNKIEYVKPEHAEGWVDSMIAKHFPPETHYVVHQAWGNTIGLTRGGD